MIMPSKYVREEEAIIGVGSILLQHIKNNINISTLWENVKTNHIVVTFDRFVIALDFLYILGIIDVKQNDIVRIKS